MATALHDYTRDALTQLVAAGARPDIVQIGNGITAGMEIDVCDSNGQPVRTNQVTGAISNWANLAALLKAGSNGVKEIDPSILVMIFIDRGNDFSTSREFVTNAMKQGVVFDIFGEACYTAFQGQPSDWQSTFSQLASTFPSLKLAIAEYGAEQRAANDVIFNLSNQQGIGTFNWEPTHEGRWNTGHALFGVAGNAYTSTGDLALYDLMKAAYASRL
jgi:arabinogalactan endo-1,4-beta-galactosidase